MTKDSVMEFIGRGGNIVLGAYTWSLFLTRKSPQCWWWLLGWMAFFLLWVIAVKLMKVGRYRPKVDDENVN